MLELKSSFRQARKFRKDRAKTQGVRVHVLMEVRASNDDESLKCRELPSRLHSLWDVSCTVIKLGFVEHAVFLLIDC